MNTLVGNSNAGATFTKAANAIKGLEVEITADNAMSFTRGKTKVANIGAKSGKYMKEFCQTGEIEKLNEKRKQAGP